MSNVHRFVLNVIQTELRFGRRYRTALEDPTVKETSLLPITSFKDVRSMDTKNEKEMKEEERKERQRHREKVRKKKKKLGYFPPSGH